MTRIHCDNCGAPDAEKVTLQYDQIKESRMRTISTHDLCDQCVQFLRRNMSTNYGKTFPTETAAESST